MMAMINFTYLVCIESFSISSDRSFSSLSMSLAESGVPASRFSTPHKELNIGSLAKAEK
jgi:hypothetical protein